MEQPDFLLCEYGNCKCSHFWAPHFLDQDEYVCKECSPSGPIPHPSKTAVNQKPVHRIHVDNASGYGFDAILDGELNDEEGRGLQEYLHALDPTATMGVGRATLIKGGARGVAMALRRHFSKDEIYHTTFCNQGHSTRDGVPIEHECYVIPPTILAAEQEADFALCHTLMAGWRKRDTHKGRKR